MRLTRDGRWWPWNLELHPRLMPRRTQLPHIRSRGARIVVLNCMVGSIGTILWQASYLEMVEEWVWLVTNDAFAFDGLYKQGQPIP